MLDDRAAAERGVDELDVLVAEAMLLQALGPDSDAMRVQRDGDDVLIELTPLGRVTVLEMSATSDEAAQLGWMDLLAPTLVELAAAVTGEQWRAELEVASELLAARRADEIVTLAQLAQSGPIRVSTAVRVGDLIAAHACDVRLLSYL